MQPGQFPIYKFPDESTLRTYLGNKKSGPDKVYDDALVARTASAFANKSMGEMSMEGDLGIILRTSTGISDWDVDYIEINLTNDLKSCATTERVIENQFGNFKPFYKK